MATVIMFETTMIQTKEFSATPNLRLRGTYSGVGIEPASGGFLPWKRERQPHYSASTQPHRVECDLAVFEIEDGIGAVRLLIAWLRARPGIDHGHPLDPT